MNQYLICLASASVLATGSLAGNTSEMISKYTATSGAACSELPDAAATGAHTLGCPGVYGFRLLIHEDDERSSISIVTPEKRIFPLNYWDVVSRGFSSLGAKAEWRIVRAHGTGTPAALIVRVNTIDQSDPEHPRRVPLLAVAKISSESACVISIIDARASDANYQARQSAMNGNAPCLSSELPSQPPKKG